MPASCAARATFTSGTAVPARTCKPLDGDIAEAAAEPDHDARDAAVAHDQIGAEADHGDGDIGGEIFQEIGEVGFVLRHEQKLRRAADAKPSEFRQRLIGEEPAAQLRHGLLQRRRQIGKRHGLPVTRL